MLQEKTS
jgi:hypothetical protein